MIDVYSVIGGMIGGCLVLFVNEVSGWIRRELAQRRNLKRRRDQQERIRARKAEQQMRQTDRLC